MRLFRQSISAVLILSANRTGCTGDRWAMLVIGLQVHRSTAVMRRDLQQTVALVCVDALWFRSQLEQTARNWAAAGCWPLHRPRSWKAV